MTAEQIRATATTRGWIERVLAPLMPSLALTIGLIAVSSDALACGGGGSGSYRKPPRPDHHTETTSLNPQSETRSGTTTAPEKNQ